MNEAYLRSLSALATLTPPPPTSPRLDPESQRAVDGCPQAPGLCVRAGVALEWAQGNWSVSLEGEEADSGSGLGSGHGAAERADGRAMLSSIWETEGLQTVGIVVLLIASIKLLHLLGLISFSEGKKPGTVRKTVGRIRSLGSSTPVFFKCFIVLNLSAKSPRVGRAGVLVPFSSPPDWCFINMPCVQLG